MNHHPYSTTHYAGSATIGDDTRSHRATIDTQTRRMFFIQRQLCQILIALACICAAIALTMLISNLD